jgi:hypothetical protein
MRRLSVAACVCFAAACCIVAHSSDVEMLAQEEVGKMAGQPGGPGPDPKAKVNNKPAQRYLDGSVVDNAMHINGKAIKEVGYPKHKRMKGEQGNSLLVRTPPIPAGAAGHKASDGVYVGGGKMTAQDLKGMLDTVRPLLQTAALGKKMDRKAEQVKIQKRNKKVADLLASLKKGNVGKRLLDGKLGEKLNRARGDLLLCKGRLAKCLGQKPAAPTLGEAQMPLKKAQRAVKTTAKQDDRKARGEQDPAAKDKRRDAVKKPFKHTANENYVRKQREIPSERAPGWKYDKDRLTAKSIHVMTEQVSRLLRTETKFSKAEDQRNLRTVQDAETKVNAAEDGIAAAKAAREAAAKPKSYNQVMKKYLRLRDAASSCQKDVKVACAAAKKKKP